MNDLVHLVMGLSIASAFGFTGRRRWALGLFAVAPDWDVITTPLIPHLITGLDLDHATGHALVIGLGHGAFSHSLLAMSAIVAIAWATRLRGRSLAAAATAVASHYPLDFVLTWSVWPFLPFSDRGIAWGVVTTGDAVVTSLAGAIALFFLIVDIRAWRRRRRGASPTFTRQAWTGALAIVLLAASLATPAVMQHRMLREHAPGETAVADPISYTRHAVIIEDGESLRMVLVDARAGVLGEMTVAHATDATGGRGAEALTTIRRALDDADAPNPLVRPVLVARTGETGALVVEAREASTLLAERFLGKDSVGLDFAFNAEGAVTGVFARKGETSARLPVETLPTSVRIA